MGVVVEVDEAEVDDEAVVVGAGVMEEAEVVSVVRVLTLMAVVAVGTVTHPGGDDRFFLPFTTSAGDTLDIRQITPFTPTQTC